MDEKKDKVLQNYANSGYDKNVFGWYFNPYIDEYDEDYDPHKDPLFNEELNKKGNEGQEENPYKNMTLKELEEELAKVNEQQDDLYHYGAHQLNGLEDADGDKWAELNKKEKLIKEQIKDRKKREREAEEDNKGSNDPEKKGEANETKPPKTPEKRDEGKPDKKTGAEESKNEEERLTFLEMLRNLDKLKGPEQTGVLMDSFCITRKFIKYEDLKLILPDEQCKKIEEALKDSIQADIEQAKKDNWTEERINKAIQEIISESKFIIVKSEDGKYKLSTIEKRYEVDLDLSKMDESKVRGVAYKVLQNDNRFERLGYSDDDEKAYAGKVSKIACESIEKIQAMEDAKLDTPAQRKVQTLTEQVGEYNDKQPQNVKGKNNFSGIAGTPIKVDVKGNENNQNNDEKNNSIPSGDNGTKKSDAETNTDEPGKTEESEYGDLLVEPISNIEIDQYGVIVDGIDYGFMELNDIIMPSEVLMQDNLINKIEYLRRFGDERIVAALENAYLDEHEIEGLSEQELKVADKRFIDSINNYCDLIQSPEENNNLQITYNLKLKLKDFFKRDKTEFKRLKETAYLSKDYANVKAGPFTKLQFKFREFIDKVKQKRLPNKEIKQMPVSQDDTTQKSSHERYLEDLQNQAQQNNNEQSKAVTQDMLKKGQYDHSNIQYSEGNKGNDRG